MGVCVHAKWLSKCECTRWFKLHCKSVHMAPKDMPDYFLSHNNSPWVSPYAFVSRMRTSQLVFYLEPSVRARHIVCTRAMSQPWQAQLRHGIRSLRIQSYASPAWVRLCHLEMFCMLCALEQRGNKEWIRRTRPQVEVIYYWNPCTSIWPGSSPSAPPLDLNVNFWGELKCNEVSELSGVLWI